MLTNIRNLRRSAGLEVEDDSQDDSLLFYGGRASARIRSYCRRYFGAVVSAIEPGEGEDDDTAIVTCYQHGLTDGDAILLSRTDCTPTINDEFTVTVIDDDTFSIELESPLTAAGESGFFNRIYTEYLNGNGSEFVQTQERPILAVRNVWVNDSGRWTPGNFSDDNLLATDAYTLVRTKGIGKTGELYRTNGWPARILSQRDLLRASLEDGAGNVRVDFVGGYSSIPGDVQQAVEQCARMFRVSRKSGGPMQSESIEDYSYTRMSAEDEAKAFNSVKSMLAPYRTPVVAG